MTPVFPPPPPPPPPALVEPPAPGPGMPPAMPPAPRPRRRFLAGLLAGVAATALVFSAVLLIVQAVEDDATPSRPSAAAPSVQAQADNAAANPIEPVSSLYELVVAARPSIVAIHTTVTQTDTFGREVQGEAAGTGWVMSQDGYIATNAHVVAGSKSIAVALDDGSSEAAELIASDPRSDLAVLKIDRDNLVPLPVGSSETLNVGDPVVAIGNALDLGAEPTVTDGIVSAKNRSIVVQSGQTLVNLIQTSAAINPGNSGGPLLDLEGRVVGINTAIAGQGQNIGFAISIDRAASMIDQLRNGDVPRHALLGVTTQPISTTSDDPADEPSTDGTINSTGAQIVSVSPGSAADAAGLREGDIILAVDEEQITSPEDLGVAIATREPGDQITITVGRDGDTLAVDATLGAHDTTDS